jgi:acetylornithine/succinyldiaminopimelate/putrescine aminotransferase
MKAVINALEVGLKILENISKKQEHLEKELKQIKSKIEIIKRIKK